MSTKQYTLAQKAAYYKKRAAAGKPKKKYAASKSGKSWKSGLSSAIRSGVSAALKSGMKSVSRKLTGSGDYHFPIFSNNNVDVMGMGNNIGSMIRGSGDYKTNSKPDYNVLVNAHQIPQFGTSRMTNYICHREYIGDVITSSSASTFSNNSYPINAGLSGTFPWLSGVAANYEQYKVHGMVFEFRTMSADALNSTNTALGSVIMACEYNSANANFVNKQQMENYEYAVSCKPSESCYCAIECAKGQTPLTELYVRDGSVPTGQDQKTYDLGNFQIATTGMQGTSVNVGELWVTFCIELLKPRLTEGNIGLDVLTFKTQLQAASLTAAHPLATSNTQSTGNTLTVILTPTTITWPTTIVDGQYLINYYVVGGSTTVTAPVFTATTNCTLVSLWAADANSSAFVPNNGNTSPYISVMCVVSITGPGPVVSVGTAGTLPSSPTSGDLMITQFSSNISS